MDKTLQNQLTKHLVDNQLISHHHHGGVRGSSTTTALVTLLEVKLATLRLAHRIMHKNVPEELSAKMPQNVRNWNIKKIYKFDTKPRKLNKNKRTMLSFQNRAYIFNTLPHRLTSIKETKFFNKWVIFFF